MRPDFHEGFQSSKRDPLDAADPNFDWKQLYGRLSEDAADGDNDKRLAETVSRLLQLLIPFENGRIRVESVGINLIALAWVLNPGYFAGAPSLRQLAQRCGIEPSTLARHTGRFSRFIRWRNRGQRHAWNWHPEQRPPSTDGHSKDPKPANDEAGASRREKAPGK